MITVSGGFHNAPEIVILPRVADGRLKLSARQVARIRAAMCGMSGCACHGTAFGLTVEGATFDQLYSAMSETGV